MTGHGQQGSVPSLPDFRGGEGTPQRGSSAEPSAGGGPSGSAGSGGRRSGLAWILGCGGVALVLLIIAAVIVSLTILRGGPEEQDPTSAGPDGTEASDGGGPRGEYIPTEEPTDEPQPEDGPTMTVAPSTECSVHPIATDIDQVDGELRGGGLSIPIGPDWAPYSGGEQPMMQDTASAWAPIRNGWYAVATVGRVVYTEEEGGMPDLATATRHLFECSITMDDSIELFGEEPVVTNLAEEDITVDGIPGRRLTAEVEIREEAGLAPSTRLRYIVTVVDTPNGPSGIVTGAVDDLDGQLADQQAMADDIQVIE